MVAVLTNAGWLNPHAFIDILRIANAIGNAAAQSSAMNQKARGPNAP
jgi:arginine exporter protein ArgO